MDRLGAARAAGVGFHEAPQHQYLEEFEVETKFVRSLVVYGVQTKGATNIETVLKETGQRLNKNVLCSMTDLRRKLAERSKELVNFNDFCSLQKRSLKIDLGLEWYISFFSIMHFKQPCSPTMLLGKDTKNKSNHEQSFLFKQRICFVKCACYKWAPLRREQSIFSRDRGSSEYFNMEEGLDPLDHLASAEKKTFV